MNENDMISFTYEILFEGYVLVKIRVKIDFCLLYVKVRLRQFIWFKNMLVVPLPHLVLYILMFRGKKLNVYAFTCAS